MTVRMILPDSEAGVLHAWRRVTTFTSLTSLNRLATIALTARKGSRNGIILLTFTA
jgi:hypothetical protein